MLIDRFRKLLETWDAELVDEVYAPDALIDANVPSWRFQRQGLDQIRDQYASWSPRQPYRLVEWKATDIGGAVIVEVAMHEHEGTPEQVYTREVHILKIDGDRITEHTLYCTGPWDRETVARQRAEAPMVRELRIDRGGIAMRTAPVTTRRRNATRRRSGRSA